MRGVDMSRWVEVWSVRDTVEFVVEARYRVDALDEQGFEPCVSRRLESLRACYSLKLLPSSYPLAWLDSVIALALVPSLPSPRFTLHTSPPPHNKSTQTKIPSLFAEHQFASLLLSRLPLPSSPPTLDPTSSPKALALHSAISLLTFSLSNIVRETDFFVATAKEHGLEIHSQARAQAQDQAPAQGQAQASEGHSDSDEASLSPNSSLLGEYEPITKSYVDFLVATAAGGSVEEGLVLLWAMEQVSVL
jgi:hypothetical protein